MNDPKITLDTVAQAVALLRQTARDSVPFPANDGGLFTAIRDVAALNRLQARIVRLNERACNGVSDGGGHTRWNDADAQANDLAVAKLIAKADKIAKPYGATMHRYGRGGGLWPHATDASGGDIWL